MFERCADWEGQARRDISSAEIVMDAGFYEWTCFMAQQCAEKAVTSLYQKVRVVPYGHEAADLLRRLKTKAVVPDEVLDDAKALDTYYDAARYPDRFDAGVPIDHISREDAEMALVRAKRILQFCKGYVAGKETVMPG